MRRTVESAASRLGNRGGEGRETPAIHRGGARWCRTTPKLSGSVSNGRRWRHFVPSRPMRIGAALDLRRRDTARRRFHDLIAGVHWGNRAHDETTNTHSLTIRESTRVADSKKPDRRRPGFKGRAVFTIRPRAAIPADLRLAASRTGPTCLPESPSILQLRGAIRRPPGLLQCAPW